MEEENKSWLANLRHIEKNGADFFVTGGSCAVVGFDLNYLPGRGINLSGVSQTLRQGYSVAKHVFEHVEPGTIKFVIIDLSSCLYNIDGDNAAFDVNEVTTEEVDLNYERAKENFKQTFSEQKLIDSAGIKLLTDEDIEEISQVLKDYCKLCLDNAAKPVGILFPAEQTLQKTFNADVLARFRKTITAAEKNYRLTFIDFLKTYFKDIRFYGTSHLNSAGATRFSALLGERLCLKGIISAKTICGMKDDYFNVLSKSFPGDFKTLSQHAFCNLTCDYINQVSKILPKDRCRDLMARLLSDKTYNHLAILSDTLPKDEYNDIAARVFEISAEKIRRKNKIKVGFVIIDWAQWSGDDLYNHFVNDKRFEVTVFDCLRLDKAGNEIIKGDFLRGVEYFKKCEINVLPLDKNNAKIPPQDVIIFLTPYFHMLPAALRPENLSVQTLMAHIPYTLTVSQHPIYNYRLFRVAWKIFFESTINLKDYDEKCKVGMPRGLYSGYPRIDILFKKNAELNFNWKMARPDAKKIIWAPHWSITGATRYATFQWNYQFMYEFAKAHPEISWVVKPHQALFFSAVERKIFPSTDAFKEYLQMWDDLPNAQVCTGAYYHAIFATSDGMIQDCASFVAEYQYVDKPMIYLTRAGAVFNELGDAILKTAYLVSGKDLDGIAAMMQRVFIEGDDYKAAERKEVFDKYLNYPKTNGMLASEFIFKSITDELKPNTED